ncbi:hypothetical protein ANO11243_027140 [Dothideomycetidae sp. 11243]|nr:hypothetical protein ANO11243_027140 [fungal sp. No.11243]
MSSTKPRLLFSLARVAFVAFVGVFLLVQVISHTKKPASVDLEAGDEDLRCRHLPGAEDTLVVMRTGVNELAHKLPVHLETTLRCYPHYMIFSDHGEDFQGQQIIDSLSTVNPKYKENAPEFEMYRRVREGGRDALGGEELTNKAGMNRHPSDEAKLAMGGWRVDKWKFLAVWNHTYHVHPDKKWYMFVEADTYLFWSNLLRYQQALDHTKPIYAGAEMFFDWTSFAHGGGGILMSNPAMKRLVDEFTVHADEWDDFTDRHWAGDIVLGRVLNAAGVVLTPAWPHFHPHAPGNDTYYWADDDRRFWCYPALSYHHVNPEVVRELWGVEQKYIAEKHRQRDHTGRDAMKRREIFMRYIFPKMEHPTAHWDNSCYDDHGEISGGREECMAICERNPICMQWRYDDTTSKCSTNNEPKWGDAAPNMGFFSGWMHSRIRTWIDEQIPCGNEGWIL